MTEQTQPGFWRRAVRRVATISVTMLVVAGAGAAAFFGSGYLGDRAEASGVSSTADLIPVAVRNIAQEEGYVLPRQFVGQVEASASVVLSFERGGRLDEVRAQEGAQVRQGQVLARLDTSLLQAEADRLTASQAATQAQLDLAQTRLTRAERLRADGHVSQEAVDQALANRDELASRSLEIAAALDSVAINLEKSELRAPFDGRIGRRDVDGGETLAAGAPVLTVIETAAPQVRVGLPLSLDLDALSQPLIEVNGMEYLAELDQVRPDIDPVTRTRTALFNLPTADALTFGQTATLVMDNWVPTPGSWVPLDALQEGVGGAWSLLVVHEDTVRVALVDMLHADDTRAFVSGTFAPDAQMIATGAHRVVPGQRVRVLQPGE